ncbi:hypothetical protein PRIEUP_LOCUS14869 [Pristimantis euphronides]
MEKVHYYDCHDHTEAYYKSYFSKDGDPGVDEMILYPIQKLIDISGSIGGDSLIDLTAGVGIAHLLVMSDSYQDITMLNANVHYMKELEKWKEKQPDALDLSHWSQKVCDLTSSRESPEVLEEKLRKKVKRILYFSYSKENITHPHVLPKVDCVMSVWSLGPMSKDQASYTDNMKKLASLLKVGGHLVVFGGFNASYFTIGSLKHHTLIYDEKTVRMALTAAGCSIKSFQVDDSYIPDHHIDNSHLFCALAVKEQEV